MLDSAFQNAHYNRRNAKHSKMRCRQANLHLFGISFSLWKIFNLSSFRWYVDERERDLRRNQQIYIRRIPGGNNSFWQAWNTLRHVILLLRPSLCLSLSFIVMVKKLAWKIGSLRSAVWTELAIPFEWKTIIIIRVVDWTNSEFLSHSLSLRA